MNTIATIFTLVQKDIKLQKRTMFFMLFFIFMLLVSLSSSQVASDSPYITVSVGGAIFWMMSVCSYEGFYKMDRLFASLPISRAEMVYARYASGFLTIINVIALSAIFGWFITVLNIRKGALLITWMDALVAFTGASLLLFGYLPVYFKLGYLRSRMVNIAVFAILGALIVLLSLLVDKLGLATATTPLVTIILGVLLWAVLAFLSIKLAVKFFRQREL